MNRDDALNVSSRVGIEKDRRLRVVDHILVNPYDVDCDIFAFDESGQVRPEVVRRSFV